MQAPAQRAMTERHDNPAIVLHWATAFLVVFMWCGAHAIDWFPKGALRVDARSVHIVVGAALAGLLAYRVYWRAARGVRTGQPSVTAGIVHAALYGLLFAVLALGIANAWLRGDSLFGLIRIPAFGAYAPAARHALSEQVVGWHALAANAILVLAACHGAAALYHHFVLHDGVLARMLPRRSGADEE